MFGNIINSGKESKPAENPAQEETSVKPTQEFEFEFRVINSKRQSAIEKIRSTGSTEDDGLSTALNTAREKFPNAVEINYTGKFLIINKEK